MIELLIILAVAGIIVWFVTSLPMPPLFRNAILAVAAICLLIYLAQFFGLVNWDFPQRRR